MDDEIARLKLETLGISIDKLTPEQKSTSPPGRKEHSRNFKIQITNFK
jgi:hypothetical protein